MFTQRFNELLRETNTTKAKVAANTGIPLETICNWFNRGSQPTADKLVKIADFFEVSVDYLLGRTSDIGIVEINCELTAEQEELLKLLSNMTPNQRNTLMGFAKGLLAQ